jgi:hypothetical protein
MLIVACTFRYFSFPITILVVDFDKKCRYKLVPEPTRKVSRTLLWELWYQFGYFQMSIEKECEGIIVRH